MTNAHSHGARLRSFGLLVTAGAVLSCGGAEPVAFSVAGVDYTESELLGLSDSRRQLLAELTAFAAIVAEDRIDEFVEPRVDSARVERMWTQLQAERLLDDIGVPDSVLRNRYHADPDYELTVRHLIVFADRYQADPVRAEARAKARRALERIQAGEPFPDVAAEVSDEPGAESREGLLNPGREDTWVDEFWAAAVALDPGQISDVVETQYGFHVLRLEARDTVPFAEARADVAVEAARTLASLDAPMPAPDSVRAMAAELGFRPDSTAMADVRRERVVEVEAQAELLGIPLGLTSGNVQAAAQRALAAGGQNAELARDRVHAWREQLDRIHPLPETVVAGGA